MPVTTRQQRKTPRSSRSPSSPSSPTPPRSPRSPRATRATAKAPTVAKAPRRAATKAPTVARSPRRAATKAPTVARVPRSAYTVANTEVPKRRERGPYDTPFWPPSNYQVPGKVVAKSPTPLPSTMTKYREFIVELKNILINERETTVIDRYSNPKRFAELIAEQEYVLDIYKLLPYKIICFVKYDHTKSKIFHKGNGMFGNREFRKFLVKNRTNVKKSDDDMIYLHK